MFRDAVQKKLFIPWTHRWTGLSVEIEKMSLDFIPVFYGTPKKLVSLLPEINVSMTDHSNFNRSLPSKLQHPFDTRFDTRQLWKIPCDHRKDSSKEILKRAVNPEHLRILKHA